MIVRTGFEQVKVNKLFYSCYDSGKFINYGGMDIFIVTKRTDDLIEKYLNPEENKRYNSLSSTKLRYQFLAGRIVVKRMVNIFFKKSKQINTDVRDIIVRNVEKGNEKGRPYIYIPSQSDHGLNISITHSKDYVASVIGESFIVGIDCEECYKRDHSFISLVFTNNEWELCNTIFADLEEHNRITLLWILKECLVKAIGIGFLLGFKAFELYLDELNKNIYVKFHEKMIPYVPIKLSFIQFYYGFLNKSCFSIAVLKICDKYKL
ncbi:MAG: 4'-phosphopantetheinyl transferase superfamily protein [Halanaerobiales bacterium]|nr:4'-phosphopantetheinyl transferase superfamily protein [Halanaerobiales bacterium]